MIFLNVTIIAFLLFFGPKLFAWLIPGKKIDFWPYLALGLLIAGLTNFLGVFMALLQAQKKVISYVIAQISRFTVLVGLTLLLLIEFRRGAAAPLWGELASTGLLVVILSLFTFHDHSKKVENTSTELPPGGASSGRKRFFFSETESSLAFCYSSLSS